MGVVSELLTRLGARASERVESDEQALAELVEVLASDRKPKSNEAQIEALLERCGMSVSELEQRVALVREYRKARDSAARAPAVKEAWRASVAAIDAAVKEKLAAIAEHDKQLEQLRQKRDALNNEMNSCDRDRDRARELLKKIDAAQAAHLESAEKIARRAQKVREFAKQQLPRLEASRKRLAAAVADAERAVERAANANFSTREELQRELGARQAELSACEADLADARNRAENAEAVAQLEAAARGEGVL